MPRCLNCNYPLVLLEHRRKYKCAKCGRLFPKKEIDDKEFREFNKKRRAEAKKESKKEAKKEYDKLYIQENKERIKIWRQEYYKKNREKFINYSKERRKNLSHVEKDKSKQAQTNWRENNRELYNAQKREYWANNHEHLLEKRKDNYQKRKPEILLQQALYRQNNKTLLRIRNLREQQKVLALRMFEFNLEKALNTQIQEVLPTYSLS